MPTDVLDLLRSHPAPLYGTMQALAIPVPTIPNGMTEAQFDAACQPVMAAAGPVLAVITESPHSAAAKRTLEILRDSDVKQIRFYIDQLHLNSPSKGKFITIGRYANGAFYQDEITSRFKDIPNLPNIKKEVGQYLKAAAGYCLHLLERDLTPEQQTELTTQYAAFRSAVIERPAYERWLAARQNQQPVTPLTKEDHSMRTLFGKQDVFNMLDDFGTKTAEQRTMARNDIISALNNRGINLDRGGIDITYRGHHNKTILDLAAHYREGLILHAVCNAFVRNNTMDGTDINNDSTLHTRFIAAAVRIAHVPALRILKHDGIDLNKRTKNGNTLLHIAAENGLDQMVKALLEVEALPLSNNAGQTPLHVAYAYNHLHIAERIQSYVNAQDHNGNTKLHLAVLQQNSHEVSLWLHAGADQTITNMMRQTPFLMAMPAPDKNIVAMLRHNINRQDPQGNTRLHRAAAQQDRHLVISLIRGGASISSKNHQGKTPSDLASNGSETFKTLQRVINRQDHEGNTPLHHAALNGDIDKAQRLLSAGVNPLLENKEGLTALYVAAQHGKGNMVKLLIQENIPRNSHVSYLLIEKAAKLGHEQVIKMLGEAGLNLSPSHPPMDHLISKAAQSGNIQMLKTLKAAGIDLNLGTLLHMAANGKQFKTAALIEAGADKEARDDAGRTPLHVAAAHGRLYCVNDLLHAGADLTAQDSDGNTPLHLAAMRINGGMVKHLLNVGADKTATNHDGKIPIELATHEGTKLAFFPKAKHRNALQQVIGQVYDQALPANGQEAGADQHNGSRRPSPLPEGQNASHTHWRKRYRTEDGSWVGRIVDARQSESQAR